jgi:hypothetical protein
VETQNGKASTVIASMRDKPRVVLLFGGFGPLVVGVILFVLMLLYAPSVAPEHIVDKAGAVRRVPVPVTTTTLDTTTSVTSAP